MSDQTGIFNNVAFVGSSSGNVAAGVAAATLAAPTAPQTNYLTGFTCTGSGSTAGTVVSVSLSGVVGGPYSFSFTAPTGVLVGAIPLVVSFIPPLPATASATAITVSMPSLGAGSTNAAVSIFGFKA